MTDPACLVDSNLLVYAYEPSAPEHSAALDFVSRLMSGDSAVVSVQNLAEFFSVCLEKKRDLLTRDAAYAALDDFSKHFRVIAYGSATVREAIRIRQATGTHFFDALLAATMLENGVHTIYTQNAQDFSKIPGIKAVNPFE